MSTLLTASPARVFESRLARIEVLQPIAAPDGRSPEGPHTHFLPELLARGDGSDPPNAPQGWAAQVVAYPPHPLRDVHGRAKAFALAGHRCFQTYLDAFGDPEHRRIKNAVIGAVRSGAFPERLAVPSDRLESVRIALRQLRCLDGESEALDRWRLAYDRASPAAPD